MIQQRRRRLTRRDGFSLVEVMAFGAIASFVLLYLVNWINKPSKGLSMILTAGNEATVNRAGDIMINDLREADPISINWAVIPPTGTVVDSLSFQKTSYDLSNPSTSTVATVQYSMQASTNSPTVSLVRTDSFGGTSILLTNLDPPSISTPLIQGMSLNMLKISLSYHPIGSDPILWVRLVAIKG